jgi:hypothetical protein
MGTDKDTCDRKEAVEQGGDAGMAKDDTTDKKPDAVTAASADREAVAPAKADDAGGDKKEPGTATRGAVRRLVDWFRTRRSVEWFFGLEDADRLSAIVAVAAVVGLAIATAQGIVGIVAIVESERTLRISERARLAVRPVADFDHGRLVLEIENVGKAPGTDVAVPYAVNVTRAKAPPRFMSMGTGGSNAPLFPGFPMRVPIALGETFTLADRDAIEGGAQVVRIEGRLVYLDGFEQRDVTPFCFIYAPKPAPIWLSCGVPKGVEPGQELSPPGVRSSGNVSMDWGARGGE